MKTRYRLTVASLAASIVFPCSFDTTPLFVPVRVPEKVAQAFVNGRLGIITPTLSARYKVVAWRYLSGLSIDPAQRDAITQPAPEDLVNEAIEKWQNARRSVGPASKPYLRPDKQSRLTSVFYSACLSDAFLTAVKTLEDRRSRYGSAQLLESWAMAQDQVFDNCESSTPNYPTSPDASSGALARADREYQIAAAHFYAEDLDTAEQLFRSIAQDANSPWKDTAAYLVGRTLLRKSVLKPDPDLLDRAKEQLQTITAGPFQNSAQGLIRYIERLKDPAASLPSLAERLGGDDFITPWREATFVLTADSFREALSASNLPEPFAWIRALEADAPVESVERWRDSHSPLWLTAAMIHAEGKAPYASELIEAASSIRPDSPAYDSITYHSIRLMLEGGKIDEARRRLDNLLAGPLDLDSFSNALRAQRLSVATSYDDFLRWAPRTPISDVGSDADLDADSSVRKLATTLDRDATDVLNYFTPLPKLATAAESTRLPDGPRSELAMTAWTRAFILGDREIANREINTLSRRHPGWTSDLNAFRDAAGEERRFAGAVLIERHSELSPTIWADFRPHVVTDSAVPDWWCAEPSNPEKIAAPPEAVLSKAERERGEGEVAHIRAAGATQMFLAPIVMSWADAHPRDPRVPEALHRLVNITRYGCRGVAGNGAVSKAAFDLLHKRYPASTWAKQTPYWFR